jgi:hypothetical protein
MRGMIERTSVAGLVLGGSAILVPVAVLAATLNYGGLGHFGGSLVRPGQMAPGATNIATQPRNHVAGWEPLRHHRRVFGFALPVTGIGPYYVAPTAAPEFDPGITGSVVVPTTRDRLSVDRGGCHTETRTVPSETGGIRRIMITSCWQG